MKSICNGIFLIIFLAFAIVSVNAQNQSGQDSTGLPGDNFSLQGALYLFQNANSIEAFEQQLNTESNHVNNLDLNGDGDIDYVRVVDKTEKGMHALILQVPISDNESQDIAVIELEKTGDTTAVLQIIGDADIYGEEVIVEPGEGDSDGSQSTQSKGGGPKAYDDDSYPAVVVNVWMWPSVRFVYSPYYHPWVSPYRWHYYPAYWHPWHPAPWHVWHPYYTRYHHSYAVVHTNRVVNAHHMYSPVRTSSMTVTHRYATPVGHYRVTKSTTHMNGPYGHGTTVKKTTVKTPHGYATSRHVSHH